MREVPGFDGYAASEDGRIISLRDGRRELKQREVMGYLNVTLSVKVGGKHERRRHPVHRLVCLAFHGKPSSEGNLARHLNGDSRDNRLCNLAWGSHADNTADAIRHGTLGKGMKARRRKLDESDVASIRTRLAAGESSAALAAEFGVSPYYPAKLAAGVRWSHLG